MKVRKAIIAVVLVVVLLLIVGWIWKGPVRLWFYYRSHFAGSQVVGWISGTPKEEEMWYAEIDYHGPKVKVYGTLVLTDSNYPGEEFWIRNRNGEIITDYAHMVLGTQHEKLLRSIGDELFGTFHYSYWGPSMDSHFWFLRDETTKLDTLDDYFMHFNTGLIYEVCDPEGKIDREKMMQELEEVAHQTGYQIPFLVIRYYAEDIGEVGYNETLVTERHWQSWTVKLEGDSYGEIEIAD